MRRIELPVRSPFDFEATVRLLEFPVSGAIETYTRIIDLAGSPHLLEFQSAGGRARPRLKIELEPVGKEGAERRDLFTAAERITHHVFSLDHDVRSFQRQIANDPLLRALEKAHRGLRTARWPTLFEALTTSILSQQISTRVAMVLKRRLIERFGRRFHLRGREYVAFPQPSTIARASPEALRALGIARTKALSIIETARAIESGQLDADELSRRDNAAIIARLTELPGIGRWTADWALILYFGRTNVYPAGDLVLRALVENYYNDGTRLAERDVRAKAERLWGEWASYAAIYLIAGLRSGSISANAPNRVIIERDGR
jgi:DNA-3-methyladenine glycosylase II